MKTILLCDCMGTQSLNVDAIQTGSGLTCSKVFTNLCGTQAEAAAQHLSQDDVIVACQQESQFFVDLAEDLDAQDPAFVDLRDRAGWGDGTDAGPKMAALTAEALIAAPMAKSVDVISEGVCLIVGAPDVAIPAAEKLADILAVTVLLPTGADIPDTRAFDVVCGRIAKARGALGGFEITLDALQQVELGGRGSFTLTSPKDGAGSQCDILLDLRGDTPLFSAHEKREGYLRPDPSSITGVVDAVLAASQMVGTFEKPLYVKLQEPLCAHSRANQPACSNCLNVCPTGAITSVGDTVAVDPMACAGCGACAAVCPSGAILYEAVPVDTIFQRLNVLAKTFRKAGGTSPRLLVHDAYGLEMIQLAARHGRGLPSDVIPLETDAIAAFGHAEIMAALGSGFVSVHMVAGAKADRETIDTQIALARALSGSEHVALLDIVDPDALSDVLFEATAPATLSTPILAIGDRRQVTRLAAKTLQPDVDVLKLPKDAPYGAVLVDTDACTLCLACVSLCPSGALADNEDKPQLRFQEDACLQCGLCSNLCPENAITLAPQMNLTDGARAQVVLNEEDPAECIECGAKFGVKSTVDKIMEKLAGQHSMFASSAAARMIQMCDNCRVQAQYHSENNPFAGGERPKVRTTDDYLSKRRDH